MTHQSEPLRIVELVYKAYGQAFVMYGEANPPAGIGPHSINFDESRHRLIADIGALQGAWLSAGRLVDNPAEVIAVRKFTELWVQTLDQLLRIQSRLTIWTPWTRRLSVLVAAEGRMMRILRETVLTTQESNEIFSKLVDRLSHRISANLETLLVLQKGAQQVNEAFVSSQKILNNLVGKT